MNKTRFIPPPIEAGKFSLNYVKIPEFNELTFQEAEHVYALNGKPLPSVTTIMKPLTDSFYSMINEGILEAAAEKGTDVHSAIEFYVYTEGKVDDIEPENAGYLEGFKQFEKDFNPEVIACETRLYHPILGYAGTADCLAWINGKLVLIDYKTTSTKHKAFVSVQLEAYAKALAAHGIMVDQKAALYLTRDGKYSMMWFEKNDKVAWTEFSCLLGHYRYIETIKKEAGKKKKK